jgi:hypothetical protein
MNTRVIAYWATTAFLVLASWALRPQSRALGVLFPAKTWQPATGSGTTVLRST